MFKGTPEPKFDCDRMAVTRGYNKNWGYFENLNNREPIGVKRVLYLFIRRYLLSRDRVKLFVVGEPGVGKSTFMRKALLYTIHRCIFRQSFEIDCRKGPSPIHNMLQFKLQYKKAL